METQAHTIARSSRLQRLVLGGFASLLMLSSGFAIAARPATAAPLDQLPYVTRPSDSRTHLYVQPSYADLWTKTYNETIPVGNYFGPSPKDQGCNADAVARGYAYGQTYLKNWWVRFEWNGLNFISVEVTCRAYRGSSSTSVVR